MDFEPILLQYRGVVDVVVVVVVVVFVVDDSYCVVVGFYFETQIQIQCQICCQYQPHAVDAELSCDANVYEYAHAVRLYAHAQVHLHYRVLS